jgi:glycosyltransferase involved in cell wall biosynthesis
LFQEIGVRAALVNQNALADERPFTVMNEVTKRYDAIYNAVMAPFKRHALAVNVPNLAIVTYFTSGSEPYFNRTREELAHAAWLNFAGRSPHVDAYKMIAQNDLARHLNEARVGLCLSAKEGAMFASIEYLLCGLSIVTTPSIGGRDVFFDPDYVATVDADPAAVGEGVRRMCERAVPPSHVRALTLRRMGEHRERLLGLLEELVTEAGRRFDREEARRRIFPNSLYKLREVHRIAAIVRRYG